MATSSAPASSVPAWLSKRFPLHREWFTLCSCQLRVDAELGAGLDMEESDDGGYIVEAVAEKPGQNAMLRPGVAIIAINDVCLLGLSEDEIGHTFGQHFRDGAELLLLNATELREAVIQKNANDECPCEINVEEDEQERSKPEEPANYELLRRVKTETEEEATVRIPVGRATAWQLDSATMADLERDLAIVSETFQLSATPRFIDAGMECIVLTGLPSAIARARREVVQILNYYREGMNTDLPIQPRRPVQISSAGYGGGTSPAVAGNGSGLPVPEHVRDLRQFQYHDHTADIIVHAWGKSRAEAFAQVVVGMFNYMTPLDSVELHSMVEVEAKGHDLLDLLFHLLDEFLYMFGTEMVICRRVDIVSFDEEKLYIKARGYGERMDLKKHEQGTEIKAITMHMMKILSPDTVLTEHGIKPSSEARDLKRVDGFLHEAYVLLDI
eukprot:TRINITY_DN2579_c1_g1_i1.p1 TRINITY_DN2579_c1_g1~~TRINITY_DN2579_c1_g1_i1.p1  ORF type:complete len:459 (+),score=106.75 TRINITY_DN2579_c1_g1_i1:53-1378(+)